ncbi:UNVERIFIED_CONTAM: hypothetical protein FKN15_039745 [Acipenser sinensis]
MPWMTFAAGRGQQPVNIRLSVMAVTRRGRGRQPIDIRLSVMAVTQRGLWTLYQRVEGSNPGGALLLYP